MGPVCVCVVYMCVFACEDGRRTLVRIAGEEIIQQDPLPRTVLADPVCACGERGVSGGGGGGCSARVCVNVHERWDWSGRGVDVVAGRGCRVPEGVGSLAVGVALPEDVAD